MNEEYESYGVSPATTLGRTFCEALGLDPKQTTRIEMVIEPVKTAVVQATITQVVISEDGVKRLEKAVQEYRAIPSDDYDAYLAWKRNQP